MTHPPRGSPLEAAAAVESAPVDGDLHLIRVNAVAHSIAARAVDDVYVDPRRLIYFAGEAVDDLRCPLRDGLRFGLNEGQVTLVDEQVPKRLRAQGVIRRRRGRGWGQAPTH